MGTSLERDCSTKPIVMTTTTVTAPRTTPIARRGFRGSAEASGFGGGEGDFLRDLVRGFSGVEASVGSDVDTSSFRGGGSGGGNGGGGNAAICGVGAPSFGALGGALVKRAEEFSRRPAVRRVSVARSAQIRARGGANGMSAIATSATFW